MYNEGKCWKEDNISQKKFQTHYGHKIGDQPYINLSGYVIWYKNNFELKYGDLIKAYENLL